MQQKNLIRQQIKNKIKHLTIQQTQTASLQMTNLLLSYLNANQYLLNNSKHIACYWATIYEINTIEFINHLLNNNKICYLPVINQISNTLDFIRYTNQTKLIKNKFNILEPEFNLKQTIKTIDLDIIFMPLIAFDALGHRIGSGSGLYDRSLIFNRDKIACPLIGLAYSLQQIDVFVPDNWDINLNFVITEKKVFDFL